MKNRLGALALAFLVAAAVPQTVGAGEPQIPHPFPMGSSFQTGGFSSGSIHLSTACAVNKLEAGGFAYTIVLSYDVRPKMLASWNYLDWILSQYPNAITTKSPIPRLFLLGPGKGKYVFSFTSESPPVELQHTTFVMFPYDTLNDKQTRAFKEDGPAKWSGVTITPYKNMLPAELVLGMTVCLPSNLKIFTDRAQ